jgi:hypothetical protein
VGVVDRLYCGVRFGLSFGDELVDLVEWVELGLEMMLDHGLLFTVVGVVLRLVLVETDEAVGDDGLRFGYHGASSCKLTIEMVCWRLYCGFGYSTAGFRHGELELCCIAAGFSVYQLSKPRSTSRTRCGVWDTR